MSRPKKENSNGKKKRSALIPVIQTGIFLLGIVGFGLLIFSYLGSDDTESKYKSLSFSKLSSFKYVEPKENEAAKSSSIPQEILALNGKKVAISGYMLPYQVDDNGYVSQFSLNGNYDMCYFGAPVSINEWVMVLTNTEQKVKYTHKPITVLGTFEVGEQFVDGEVSSVYRIVLERVKS